MSISVEVKGVADSFGLGGWAIFLFGCRPKSRKRTSGASDLGDSERQVAEKVWGTAKTYIKQSCRASLEGMNMLYEGLKENAFDLSGAVNLLHYNITEL